MAVAGAVAYWSRRKPSLLEVVAAIGVGSAYLMVVVRASSVLVWITYWMMKERLSSKTRLEMVG